MQDSKDHIVAYRDPRYKRVESVVTRILKCNKDMQEIKDKHFTITVVESDMTNAFVLPNGHIFVYT